ncbi:MAG: hypothetical protein PHV32_12810, partial [Eubacteriales bacterium]|nr:hypothetical protein [Eubacteriales bacterium]
MKKLALVLMCTLVLLFFIGFNYLVWDRENIFKNIEDNQVSIEVLSRELNNQRNAYRALQDEKDKLEENILELENSLETIVADNEQLAQQLQGKDESINVLKSQVDKTIPVQTIERWVKSINEGYYSEAYLLMHAHELAPDNAPSMKQFETLYKGKLS